MIDTIRYALERPALLRSYLDDLVLLALAFGAFVIVLGVVAAGAGAWRAWREFRGSA